MFSNNIRIVLILASAIFGGYELYLGNMVLAILFFVFIAFMAWGYFRYGAVWNAFRSMKAGDNSRARHLVEQIRKPGLLSSQQRAYYEWIFGVLESEKGAFPKAESHFRSALEHNLRTSNDRAVVESSLAETLIESGDFTEASNLLASATSRSHKAGLDKSIRELQDRIALTTKALEVRSSDPQSLR